jgi:hypothetical protein
MKKLVCLLVALLMCACCVSAFAEDEMLTGGWTAAADCTLTPEAEAALKAATDMPGCSYEPIAIIGTQVVAGVNYCILCRVTPIVPDAVPTYALVYVYAGVDGTNALLGIADIDIAAMMPAIAE